MKKLISKNTHILDVNILDSLELNIAIINSDGIIVKTNKSWQYNIANLEYYTSGLDIGNDFLNVFKSNHSNLNLHEDLVLEFNKIFDKSLISIKFKYPFFFNDEIKYYLMTATLLQQKSLNENFLIISHDSKLLNIDRVLYHDGIDSTFKQFTDHVKSLVFVLNQEHKLTYTNKSWKIFTGVQPEHEASQNCIDIIHPEDKGIFSDLLIQNMFTDKTSKMNLRLRNANNEYIWFLVNFVSTEDKSGVLATCTDINELVSTKKFLKNTLNSLSFYRMALDQFAIISIMDTKGNFKYVNYNFCKISQFSKNELIGKHFTINEPYLPDNDIESVFNNLLLTGSVWKSELKNKAKDGSVFWLDLTIKPISDSSGNITEFLSIGYDITTRKIAEIELLNSNNLLEQTGTLSNIGGISYNLQNNKISLTNEVYNILHIEKSAIIDLSFIINLFKPDFNQLGLAIDKCLATGASWDIELQINNNKQNHIWIRCIGKPIYENGEITGFLSSVIDIISAKEYDIERKKLSDDLLFKNRALLQFSYIVAHNLRAPVANILGLTSILNITDGSPENIKTLKYLEKAAINLNETIKDLNNILSIKNNALQLIDIDLNEILISTISILETNINESKVTITCDFELQKNVFTIKSYITSIFYNLLSNAIKYKHHDRLLKIHIESSIVGDFTKISFKDNGLGIDTQFYKDKLFGMYKRFHNHVDGKGLGLFIIKTQIEAMGGYIELHSKLGEGSEFCVFIPNTLNINNTKP